MLFDDVHPYGRPSDSNTRGAFAADLFLSSRIGCQLDFIAEERLLLLMKDGLGLSCGEDGMTFGSLGEGLIATTQKGVQPTFHRKDSWDMVFKAQSDTLAIQAARKAMALCQRFQK